MSKHLGVPQNFTLTPEIASMSELFPADWLPITAILGRSRSPYVRKLEWVPKWLF